MRLEKSIHLIGALGAGGAWYISPHGYNLYRTGSGDSFESLAGAYLGSASRWNEIYAMQSSSWRAQRRNDPSYLNAGDDLFMPAEAIAVAKRSGEASGGLGEPPGLTHAAAGGAVTSGGAVQTGPGAYTLPEVVIYGSPTTTTGTKSTPDKTGIDTTGEAPSSGAGLIVGGVLAVVAGAAYALNRRKVHAAVHATKRKVLAAHRAVRANPRPRRGRAAWQEA
jgi:hypothetical protein